MAQAAPTYTPQNAIDIVRKYARDAPVTSIDSQLCDIVNAIIWKAFPWPWARRALTPLVTVDRTQDFCIADDSDIHRILALRLNRVDRGHEQHVELGIRDSLVPDMTVGSMFSITVASYEPILDAIRLERAIAVPEGAAIDIVGEYWSSPEKITDGELTTALKIPDRHFHVFVEGLKWKILQYVGDDRAGSIATDRAGRKQYTGQLGIFNEALWNMMQEEDYGDTGTDFPSNPIGAREYGGLGLYG